MVKKNLKRFAAALLVCVLVCTMAACGTHLSGTYTSRETVVAQSFTFKEDNKVAISAFGLEIEGDYTVSEGEIYVNYVLLGLNCNWSASFEKDGNSIFIDGIEFIKEK